ncbi:MAG: Ig-like domain-containing protein [Christensenellaceae bacterium]|jgi:hypothetical protein|nr:Ig-like domain-containing protein [Christensenellaceae bacterium]
MKKMVIIILIFLPVVLLVFISFAGQIIVEFHHIPVENVKFIDEYEIPYPENKLFNVKNGETLQLRVKVFPERANNKNISFDSTRKNICIVDENGLVTALQDGYSEIYVMTEENQKTAKVTIEVKDKVLAGLKMNYETITLHKNEKIDLVARVVPSTAEQKNVRWISSDKSLVSVNATTGTVFARGTVDATVTITAIAIDNESLTAECVVTLSSEATPIKSKGIGEAGLIVLVNAPYVDWVAPNQIRLLSLVDVTSSEVDPADIKFFVENGEVKPNFYIDEENVLHGPDLGIKGIIHAHIGTSPVYVTLTLT